MWFWWKPRWKINLWKTQIKRSNTNLLEILLDKKRGSISCEVWKLNISLDDYAQVAEYIKRKLLKSKKK